MGKAKQSSRYELEYKMEAARMVKGGQAESVIAKILGIPKASLDNWLRLCTKDQLKGAGDKQVQVSPVLPDGQVSSPEAKVKQARALSGPSR